MLKYSDKENINAGEITMKWKKVLKNDEESEVHIQPDKSLEDWVEDNGFTGIESGHILDEYLHLQDRFGEGHYEKGIDEQEQFSLLLVSDGELWFGDESDHHLYSEDEKEKAIKHYKQYIKNNASRLKELKTSGNRSKRFLRDGTDREKNRLQDTSVKKVAKKLSKALEELISDFDYEINAIEVASEEEGLLKYLEEVRETQMSLEEEYDL